MGNVVLARAMSGPTLGSFVAIKRLHAHLEKDPHVMDAFLDEVWLINALHHPNVVEPLDWGKDDAGGYLVMQFVPGDSLRALLRAREDSQSPLPIDAVIDIIARAAEGLHAAHELKSDDGEPLDLVHRDMSPANVMIGYDGSVKVIDFGVAKATGKLVNTESGLIKGKYAYMSPEQIRGQRLDRRSDIFSLGIVAWEALTLCRLYTAPTEFEMLALICDEQPVPPSEIRGDVPAELDRIVMKCLSKRPDYRYATAEALADDLRPLRASADVARKSIAAIARESMPQRLAWIEGVTGQRVEVVETRLAVGADSTMRVEAMDAGEPVHDGTLRLSVDQLGGDLPGGSVPEAEDDVTTDKVGGKLRSPQAPSAAEDFEGATTRTPPLEEHQAAEISRTNWPVAREAPRESLLQAIGSSSKALWKLVVDRAAAIWSDVQSRTVILMCGLGAVAVLATVIGIWFGSR